MLIVADTNVILRGVGNSEGASGAVLLGMLDGNINFAISPAVVLEYEDVLTRPTMMGTRHHLSHQEVEIVLDELCAIGFLAHPWFRFRPFVADPGDDHIIECAFAGGAQIIVSDDKVFDVPVVKAFGVDVFTASNFAEWARNKGLI